MQQVDKKYGPGGIEDGKFGRDFYTRPMVNGVIQDHAFDDMIFMWDQIGQSFVQGVAGYRDK